MTRIAKKLTLAGLLMFTTSLASCGGGNGGGGGGEKTTSKPAGGDPVVTFRLNYTSGEADVFQQVTVKKGGLVEEPTTDPTRSGYTFNGWYEDDAGRFEFDFDEPIVKDTKIFASWLADLEVTFDLNYSGAPAASKVKVREKDAVSRPADPERSGYQFIGWTVNKTTGADGYDEYFDFASHIYENTTLYAKWGDASAAKAFRFEAEYCDVITKGMGMTGNTYSGSTNGKAMIQLDDENSNVNASNKHFVHFLYAQNNNLKFEINSDAAGTAKITMRLSAEYREEGFCISPNGITSMNEYDENNPTAPVKYTIKVNDAAMQYEPITFTNVPKQGEGWKKFDNYLLTASVALVKGKNTVEMITDNLVKLYGTAVSTAPMIDCLTFETNCNLNWLNAKASQVE